MAEKKVSIALFAASCFWVACSGSQQTADSANKEADTAPESSSTDESEQSLAASTTSTEASTTSIKTSTTEQVETQTTIEAEQVTLTVKRIPRTVSEPASTSAKPPAGPQTAPPQTAPSTTKQPASDKQSRAQQVAELTNAERANNGCPALSVSTKLNAAALAHSTDMNDNNYFSHNGLDGSNPSSRAQRQGYEGGAGENIAKGQRSPEEVVQAWMNSAGHRRNILNCDYSEIGVGVDDYTWTQMFGI